MTGALNNTQDESNDDRQLAIDLMTLSKMWMRVADEENASPTISSPLSRPTLAMPGLAGPANP